MFLPIQPEGTPVRFEKTKVRNFDHQVANDIRRFVGGLVVDDKDFRDFRLQRQRFDASGDDVFFVSRGHNGADGWRLRERRKGRVWRFVGHDKIWG